MHPLLSRIVSAFDASNVVLGDACADKDGLGSKSGGSKFGGALINAIELEARVLYSASPVEFDIHQSEVNIDFDFGSGEDGIPVESGPTAFSDFGLSISSDDVNGFELDPELFADPNAAVPQNNLVAQELVFIDANVENWQALLDDISSTTNENVSVVLLDADRDGVQQISETLAGFNDLSAIHLISHGNQSQLNLGSTTLSNQNLAGYAGEIANWQGSLAENADLLIYGCDLGASDSGQELLESIGALCDCDVAASDDITGHESLGGDWDLEFSSGIINHDTVISAAGQSDWVGRLAVYTVTSTADDGSVGTLRWAIDSANSNAGIDNIEFNIAGAGVQRIDMTGDRFEITEAVIIDATTQSGYTFDTPMIEIDGTNVTGSATEKDIFWITGGGTTVRGLSLINASDDAIDIEFGDGNTIAGNFIGLAADGTTAGTGAYGVDIKSNFNTVGGTTLADRNIISGNTRAGISIQESNSNVGYIPATANVLQGNWIGVNVHGDALGNAENGIKLTEDATNTLIGGTSTGEGNIIAHSGQDGIAMVGVGNGNSVRGNQIFANGGLALDLEDDGVTANDYDTVNDQDDGSNRLQNFPDIATVVYDGVQLTITGDVTGGDNVAHEVDFYASSTVDPSGFGEAERYLGSTTVTTDAGGSQSFSVDLDVFVNAGEFVSATATHSDGSTSEFSLSVAATYQPTGELLFTTDGNGPSWTDTEAVLFGDAGDSFDINAGLTNGTFSKLPGFDAPAGIRGMHYVESDVQIGDSPNHFDVQRGDIILTFESKVAVNAGQVNEFEATNKDLVVYRPGSTSDYSSGEYFMLLASGIDSADGSDLSIHGLALVEGDTTVGGTLLEAGTFLIAHSNPDHEDIATLNITAAGSDGGAADEIVNFLDGSDLGNTNTQIQGLHVLQQDTSFNGSVLNAGTLLVEVDGAGTYAGVNHEAQDVIAITVSANETNATTSAATGALLFDGSDVGLSGGSDAIQGLTVVSSGFLAFDEIIANADSFQVTQNQPIANFNVLDNDELEELGNLPENQSLSFIANGEDVADSLWEESGGTGYDLTIRSGVTFVNDPLNAPAQITGAFDLNGAGMFNATGLQDLPADPTKSDASFEFWIKPDDGLGEEIILDAGSAARGTSLKLSDSTLEFTSRVSIPFGDNDSMTVSADLSALIAAQEYIHIVGVIDFSPDATIELFVNGVSVGTDSSTVLDDWAGASNGLGIGIVRSTVAASTGSDPFQGQIAEFNFYESGLTDAQVSASYESAFKLLAVQSHDAVSAQGIAVSVATDGSVAYDPGTAFDYLQSGESTTDTFSYVATNSDGETDSAQVTVTINGQNNAPVIADQSFPVAENLANGSVVASIAANDVDSGVEGNLTYLATGGTGAAAFDVDSAGQITVSDSSLLDYEAVTSVTLEIQVSDGGSPALTDTATITINLSDVNEAPSVALSGELAGLSESTDTSSNVKVADIVVSDDALGSETLSLSGADSGDFVIVGNELFLRAGTSLDFESKTSFDVTVEVDDTTIGAGADDTIDYTLNITDVNEAPSVALANEIFNLSENADTSGDVKIADIVVSDDALGSETLSLSGADSGDFVIVGNELFLRAGTSLDFESKTSFDVTVEVDDASIGVDSEDTVGHTLGITDFNEAPTVALANQVASLFENTDTSSNVKVADIVVSDDALGSETLSLSGADSGDFVVIGNELFLRAGTSLDFESKSSYDVTVEVDDTTIGAGADDTIDYTLNITDFNEAPSVALANEIFNLSENTDTSGDVKIADIVVSDDAVGTETLSLSGADSGDFVIVGNELFLRAGTSLDFESKTSFDVAVEVDDASIGVDSEDAVSHTLGITDFNEAPTVALANQVASLFENTDTSSNVKVADIVVSDDALGSETLSLSGADSSDFVVIGNELFLRAGTSLDFESKSSFDVTVEVDDATIGAGADDTIDYTLNITDFNEAPSVALANEIFNLSENTDTSGDVKIADIVVSDDALGSETLSLSGADSGDFVIVGNELFLRAGTSLDFESKTSFDVTVEVDDASIGVDSEDTVSHTLGITDVNEAPTVSLANQVASLFENTDTSSNVKIVDIVVTDDGLGAETLSLSGADSGDFVIVGNELFLRAGTSLDFESKTSFDVTVEVDDTTIGAGADDTIDFTLNITDFNEAPTVALANETFSLPEDTDTSSSVKIADIVVSDDAIGTETLSLSGTDSGDFVIVGNELFLRAGTSLDFESKASFDVAVEVDDASIGAGPEDTIGHTLAITNVNEAPTAENPVGAIGVDEDAVDSVIDLTSVFGDIDSAALTYTLAGNDNLLLVDAAVAGNFLTLDYLQDEFGYATISVSATDGEFTVTDTFNVSVNPINDAPVVLHNGNLAASLQNNFDPPGDSVGNLFGALVLDVDPSSSLSGVAIVSNSANSLSEGDWQYSTDSGANWHPVGVVNDGLTAMALDASSLIRFVPVNDFSGIPASLEVRVLDDTFGGGFTSGLARSIVDSMDNGGTTAISAQTATLATEVASHGIIVTPIDSVTDESGGAASFEVLLLGPPTSSVSIAVASDNVQEATTSTDVLTFDATNWDIAQTVIVTGVDDQSVDGDANFSIVLGAAVSVDAGYDGMEVDDVSMSNLDNDDARVLVSETSVTTSENGRAASFAVKLSSRPTADVTIGVASDDLTEGVVSTSSLTFNASNWNVAQTVTIIGQADATLDGNTDFKAVLSPTVSGDPNFHNLDPDDVNVVNLDVVPLVQTASPPDSTFEAEPETESESESETSDEENDNTENQDTISGGDGNVSTSSDGESKPQPDAVEGYAGADAVGQQQEEVVDKETSLQGNTFWFSSDRSASVEKRVVEQVSLVTTAPAYESVLASVDLWNDLDDLKEQMETDMLMPTIVVGSATSAASVFTVGYVTWLIRGGQILVGVMARMPAWMLIDPLPILAALDSVDASSEDDSLASMVDNSNEKVAAELASQGAGPDPFENSNETSDTASVK